MNNLEKKYYDDDEDISRERSNSYDSDSTRDGYASSQSSDNVNYDFDNKLSDIDSNDEITMSIINDKNNVENMIRDDKQNNDEYMQKTGVDQEDAMENTIYNTDSKNPEIYKQASAIAIEYKIDNAGKVSIPYGIFMECKKTSDGPIVCVKRDISNIPEMVDNVNDVNDVNDEKNTEKEINGKKTRKTGKFVKTKRKDRMNRISQASKKNRKKQKKGTKRRRIGKL